MKKILLIVAVVLCVAIAGTALAATIYYKANDIQGNVTADSYIELSLAGTQQDAITLVAGQNTIYKIACSVVQDTAGEADATLTVALVPTSGKTLEGVTAALYSTSACTGDPITSVSGNNVSTSMTIDNIDESVDYWVKVSFAGAESSEALANVVGQMDIDLEQAD